MEQMSKRLMSWASILEGSTRFMEVRHTLRQILNVKGD